jgi:hypothetical protein
MIIKLNIDVTKLDKKRLHAGNKGTYANLTVLLRDETDQYGNDGMIVEDVSKEEREGGKKGTIVGNARIIGNRNQTQTTANNRSQPQQKPQDDDGFDDCPF